MSKSRSSFTTLSLNKRARFEYEIIDTFEAGIVLLGTEVKSIRAKRANLQGAFVTVHEGQAYLTNAFIPPWQAQNTQEDYDAARPRRLLLHKKELIDVMGDRKSKGLTIVPLSLYDKHGQIKVKLALARGRKQHSKKQLLKERDILRETDRMLRGKE